MAVFDSRCRYRYWLSRVWDRNLPGLAWCMLNPSTATASSNDRTLDRVLGFSRAWGYGTAEVVNLFAWRTKEPKELTSVDDPVGPDNDEVIFDAGRRADTIIAAWGDGGLIDNPATGASRSVEVRALLDRLEVPVFCLRVTQRGQPGHPLYVPGDTMPSAWLDRGSDPVKDSGWPLQK